MTPPQSKPAPPALPGKNALLLIIALSSFSIPFMTSGLNIALPTVGRELNMDAITLSWVVSSFLLSSAVFIVPMGRLGDILGRKAVFITGILIFCASSLIAGLSVSGAMLIGARALQGFGGAMMFGTEAAILSVAFPVGQRGRALGITTFMVFLGLTLGPYLGGMLTSSLGWRSIFFINVAMGLVIAGAMLIKFRGRWAGASHERFDLPGAGIYILALAPLIYGFTLLPEPLGIGFMAGGLVMLGIFVRYEAKQEFPALNVRLFRENRAFAFSSLAALMSFGATFPVPFIMSLYLQYLLGFEPERAGLIILTMPAIQAVFSLVAGRLSDRVKPKLLAAAGTGICGVGLIMLTFLNKATPVGYIIGGLALLGLGVAFFAAPNINAIMSSVTARDYGIAGAVTATMRTIGIAFGMGVVLLLMSIYVGNAQIVPANHAALLESMRISFIIFTGLCGIGVFASLAQGK
jgi:MFS family permease